MPHTWRAQSIHLPHLGGTELLPPTPGGHRAPTSHTWWAQRSPTWRAQHVYLPRLESRVLPPPAWEDMLSPTSHMGHPVSYEEAEGQAPGLSLLPPRPPAGRAGAGPGTSTWEAHGSCACWLPEPALHLYPAWDEPAQALRLQLASHPPACLWLLPKLDQHCLPSCTFWPHWPSSGSPPPPVCSLLGGDMVFCVLFQFPV